MELGPYDVALVEGSVTTPYDARRIQEVRRQSKFLVTIGACATAGGIQALRNWADHEEFQRCVYARPEYIKSLATSTAISDHVPVDFELRGCPINRHQLLEVLRSLLGGRKPRTPTHSVCLDCKRRGTVCVAVAQGIACLGPITQSGCGAICPAYDRGCYGCFGPAAQPNCDSLADHYLSTGTVPAALVPLLRNYNANAPAFRAESNRLAAAAGIPQGPNVSETRTIKVDALSRVEGEGGLHVRLTGRRGRAGSAVDLRATAVLRSVPAGPAAAEVPDIVARICGICPVAYQMSSVHALERALGVTIRRRFAACDGCCTAANGSKATHSTSTSARARFLRMRQRSRSRRNLSR